MEWVRSHIPACLFSLAVPFGFAGVINYQQMSHYNNFDTTNWLITLGWFVAAIVSVVAGGVASAWNSGAASFLPANSKTRLPASVAQVRELRTRAASYRVQADGCDAEAGKIVAAMEAELTAAKALVEGAK